MHRCFIIRLDMVGFGVLVSLVLVVPFRWLVRGNRLVGRGGPQQLSDPATARSRVANLERMLTNLMHHFSDSTALQVQGPCEFLECQKKRERLGPAADVNFNSLSITVLADECSLVAKITVNKCSLHGHSNARWFHFFRQPLYP
ncbi:hypothetical protein IWX90DRAFT_10004 [Phyllosticta citrichinensis]|uniref:Uncharacterized protein n=1 Tax=Phyllosticta citrichinensis TaxID=1130410 RepID=A0ABR1Y6S0_9PEZI